MFKHKLTALCLAVGLLLLSACGAKPQSSSAPVSSVSVPAASSVVLTPGVSPLTGLASDHVSRPVAILLSNTPAARPQSGLLNADVVLESASDGGCSILAAVYAGVEAVPEYTGPVCAARDQLVQMLLPIGALPVHIGANVYTDNLLNILSLQSIDGRYLGTNAFVFLTERNHAYTDADCWYTSAALLQAGLATLNLGTDGGTTPLFHFSDSAVTPAGGEATSIDFRVTPDESVRFVYDKDAAAYGKSSFGAADVEDGTQLAYTNVLLLYTDVTLKDDGATPNYALKSGKGLYAANGAYEDITWEKGDADDPLMLYTADGNELTVNTGKTYVCLLDNVQQPTVQLNFAAPVRNGWIEENGQRHYYENDVLATGFKQIDSTWFHLDENGNAVYGWANNNGSIMYFIEGGGVLTGEQTSDGVTYTFDENGVLTSGNVALDENGNVIPPATVGASG